MILAAGLGKRLRPLTLQTPKPLFPVLNQPLVERIVLQLQDSGCGPVFMNVFHLHEKLFTWQADLEPGTGEVVLVKERVLLGTGGGIENVFRTSAEQDTSLLVINGDIVTDLDLRRLWEIHRRHDDVLASMVVHQREPWNKIRVDSGFITSFTYDGDDAVAFTGISVLSPHFMAGLSPGPGSIITALASEIAGGGRVMAVTASDLCDDRQYIWEDIGSPAGYLMAHQALIQKMSPDSCMITGRQVDVAHGVSFRQWVCLGEMASVGPNTALERCVVWPGARVPEDSCFKDCIITPSDILCAGPQGE